MAAPQRPGLRLAPPRGPGPRAAGSRRRTPAAALAARARPRRNTRHRRRLRHTPAARMRAARRERRAHSHTPGSSPAARPDAGARTPHSPPRRNRAAPRRTLPRPPGGVGMRVPVHLAAELRRGPGVRRLPLRRRARRMQLAGCGRRPPHCRRGRLRSLQSRLRRRSARRRPAGPRLRLPRLRRRRLLGAPCCQLSGCLRRVRGRPARARRRLLRAPGLPRGMLRRRPCGLRGRLLCGPRLPPGVWLLPAGVLPAALLVLLLRRGLPPGMLLRPLLSLPGLPAGLPRVLWRAWLPAGVLRLPAGALLRARRLPASRLGRQRWRQGVRVRWQRRRRGLVWRQRRRAGPAPALSRLRKAVTSLCATVPQTQAHALQAPVTQCLARPDGQPQQQTAPVCGRGRASQAHLSAGGRSGALALKRWLRLYSEVHPGRGAAGRALPAGVAALRVVVQLLIAAVRSGLRAGPCCLVPQHVRWRVVCRPSCHQLRAAGRRRLPP